MENGHLEALEGDGYNYKADVKDIHCEGEERIPTRCNNIDDLLSIVDVNY